MTEYPAEPWDLRGQLYCSTFLVPLDDVPVDLPPGCTPIRIGRRGIVGTAWVEYEPGGVLSYREIMATLLVRRGRMVQPTIVRIWVDSEESLAGGRALWGIPKDLATFDFRGGALRAADDGHEIAQGSLGPQLSLPGRWPVAFSVVQWLHGAAKVSPIRSTARLALTRSKFAADPDGPLGFLAGHRPVASFAMRDFEMSFGSADRSADQTVATATTG